MPSIIEDRDAILQLLHRYNHAIDSGDAQGWADSFVDDGVFDVDGRVMMGRDALVKFASGVRGRRHTIANPVIDVSGDTASVHATFIGFTGKEVHIVGAYDDDLVRTPAGWRLSRRVFRSD